MTREEIMRDLVSAHSDLISYVKGLTDDQFEYRHEGVKWNAGQEVLHIVKSVKALNRALALPKPVLRVTFGKANRPSRAYEAVTARYLERVGGGKVTTTPPFEPDFVPVSNREALCLKLQEKVEDLCKSLERFSETQLDVYILPHPALGKLTLREMAYFTIYHAGHHLHNSQRNLGLEE